MKKRLHPPSPLTYSSPQEELEILFIQLQRTMVLWALAVYSRFFKDPGSWSSQTHLPQIFRHQSPQETDELLRCLKKARHFFLVRFAYWLHLQLDDSRELKEFLLKIMLWCRTTVWHFCPSMQYGNYEKWIEEYDLLTDTTQKEWKEQITQWGFQPRIVVVFLKQNSKTLPIAMESLFKQPYKNWTLVLLGEQDLLAQAKVIASQLHSQMRFQSRLEDQCHFLLNDPINDPINDPTPIQSILTYECDYHLIVPAYAKLSERSFFELVRSLQKEKVDLIYGDEDVINFNGLRSQPRFYPDWDLDFHLAQNFFRTLFAIKNSLLRDISQKNRAIDIEELILHSLLEPTPPHVMHISAILSHTFKDHSYNVVRWQEKAAKILKLYFPKVETKKSNLRRIQILWPLPEKVEKISLIIPTKDRVDLLKKLLEGLLKKTNYPIHEIIILNNQSLLKESFTYFETIQNHPKIRVLDYDHPFNYSALNNFGVQNSSGDLIGFLNNDLEVISPLWLTEMVRQILRPDVGAVGAKLYYKNDFIQHAGVVMGIGQVAGHVLKFLHKSHLGYCERLTFPHSYSAVTGACLMVKRSLFEKIGGFDTQNLPVAYNDVDLCLRIIEHGHRVLWTPYAELYHHESASRPIDTRIQQLPRYRKEIRYMRDRWPHRISDDPHYNINLTRSDYLCQVTSESATYYSE